MKKKKFNKSAFFAPIFLPVIVSNEDTLTDAEIKAQLDAKFTKVNDEMKSVIENGATKAEVLKVTDALKTQGEALQTFIDEQRARFDNNKSWSEAFTDFLEDNQDKLKDIIASKSGEIEFNFDQAIEKAEEPILTTSGGDAVTAPPNHNTQMTAIRLRDDNPLISLCNVVKTNQPSLAYTEVFPKSGDYAFVDEGESKPQIDFQWAVRYATPFKIAAHMKFSEEVVTDIPRLMDTARGYLKDKHDLFKADALYFSDGTLGTPLGATAIARPFTAGNMAGKIENPTIMDVINAIVTDIYTTHNYADETPYQPNLVLLNPVDFFINFQAAKDANRWALYSGVTLFNEYKIGALTIKPWEKMASDNIFVGDMKKYNISNWVRYSVRLGWIGNQFIENMFTMVGESRSHFYVKNFDEQAFVYDSITTVMTAITKPAGLAASLGVDIKEAKEVQAKVIAGNKAKIKAMLKTKSNKKG